MSDVRVRCQIRNIKRAASDIEARTVALHQIAAEMTETFITACGSRGLSRDEQEKNFKHIFEIAYEIFSTAKSNNQI